MEYVKLGEVATFINGYAFKPSDWKKEGIPIIRIQNLTGNNREINYYQGKIDEKYHVKKGEILISWSASIDVYEWKGKNGYLNQHIFKVVFDKMDIDKDFFVYLIKNKLNEIKKYTHGSTMKHITKSKFDNIKIRIPSKEEQIKIANKLNKIIIIIEKQKEQLELLENLKKSQFFEMFGNPIKNEKGWEKVSMDEISRLIIRGKTPKYVMDSKIGIINQACIYWEKIKFENIKYHENNEKVLTLENQDVLINSTGTGTLGRVNIFTKDKENDKVYTIDTHVTLVRLKKEKVNSIYLKNFFRVPIVQEYLISRCVNGSTNQIELSKEKFKKFRVLLPPLELQNKFATKIEAIQKLKFEIEKSLKETENLYNSLMQKFFSNK